MSGSRSISALAVASLLVSGVATHGASAIGAAEPSPRLSLVAGEYDPTFMAMSGSGAHFLIASGYDPTTGEGGHYLLYDTIGGRYTSSFEYLPTATGTSTVIFDRMSRDGEAFTFTPSHAIVEEDTHEGPDLYLHAGGENVLLDQSLGLNGTTTKHVADGGAYVIVRTLSALDPTDVNDAQDDYIWEASTRDFRLIEGPPDQSVTAVSPDDSTIFLQDPFGATSTWVDGIMTPLTTGTIQWISESGDRIHISSEAGLVAEDTDGASDAYEIGPGGPELLSGGFDIPIWMSDRHVSTDGERYVLSSTYPFGPGDTDNSRNDNVLVTKAGEHYEIPGGDEHAYVVGASDDLSILVIQTWSQLTPGDVDGGSDLYRWSINAPSDVTLLTSGSDSAAGTLVAMSPDGRRIVIETREPLVAEAQAEIAVYPDLYEWLDDQLTSLTPDTQRDTDFLAASDDGQRVVFRAIDPLVPEDDDTTRDLYVSDRDVTPPVATLATSLPEGSGLASSGAELTAHLGTEDGDGVFFECRLDDAPFEPCTSTTVFAEVPDGLHEVSARAFDAAVNASQVVSATIQVGDPPSDTDPPEGTVVIAGGAAYAASTSVTISTFATDGGSGLSQVALSNDGATWTTRAYGPSQPWTLPSTNGTRTVHVKWQDQAGNWSTVKRDTIVLDTVAPSTGKPGRALLKGKALTNGAILTRISWTGSDATSGVARYELAQQTNGGAWKTVSTTLTKNLTDRSLATEATHRFRVRAVDKAGNVGAWTYGDTFRVSRFSETNSRITYSGTWSTSKSSVFWGGQARASSRAGSRATMTFTGRSAAWISSMGPTRGKADVYVNGSRVATIDLYSATGKHQQVVWTGSWTTSASRTISIRVLGTSGRPRVDLDAFVTTN